MFEQSKTPDKIIDLKSDYCQNCGHSLEGNHFKLFSLRQVVDIPSIVPIYAEYRQHVCNCAHCGYAQKAGYLEQVKALIQYGSHKYFCQEKVRCFWYTTSGHELCT